MTYEPYITNILLELYWSKGILVFQMARGRKELPSENVLPRDPWHMILWGPMFPEGGSQHRSYLWISHNEYLPLGQILMRSHQSGNNRTLPLCAVESRMDVKAPSLGFSGRGDCCQCLGRGVWHANTAPPDYRHISHSAEADPDLPHAACEEAVCRRKCRTG